MPLSGLSIAPFFLYKRTDFTPVCQSTQTQISARTTNMKWIAETTAALSSADKFSGSPLVPPVTTPQEATTFALIVSHQARTKYQCEAESKCQSTASRFSLIPIWPPTFRHGIRACLSRMNSIIKGTWLLLPSGTSTGPTWTRM